MNCNKSTNTVLNEQYNDLDTTIKIIPLCQNYYDLEGHKTIFMNSKSQHLINTSVTKEEQ